MKKYALSIFTTHTECDNNAARDDFLIEVMVCNGDIESARLRYRDYNTCLSDAQLIMVNNRSCYSQEGISVQDVFENYGHVHDRCEEEEGDFLCRWCAYLLFFNFMTSDYFYEIVPLHSRLPFDCFSALFNRSNFTLLSYLFNTIIGLLRMRGICHQLTQYTVVCQNFINTFDLLFVEGPGLNFLDVASFVTNVLLEIATLSMCHETRKIISPPIPMNPLIVDSIAAIKEAAVPNVDPSVIVEEQLFIDYPIPVSTQEPNLFANITDSELGVGQWLN